MIYISENFIGFNIGKINYNFALLGMSNDLQFKYDNYEEDFDNDDQPSVKEFPVQTDVVLKKSPEKSQ